MQCLAPIVLMRDEPNADGYYSDKVPCGKCVSCIKRRTAQWVFRLQQELKFSDSAIFLTCTYDDDKLKYTSHGPTLVYRDHQLFIKRLRKAATKSIQPLKYYAVGEYGANFERPHFHYILYNLLGYQKEELFLHSTWGNGHIDIGTVTSASIAYVTGYVNKKIIKPKIHDLRKPERPFMSKGLGAKWLTESTTTYYHRKKLPYIQIAGGEKVSMPRYYKNKLYDSLDQVIVNSNVKLHLISKELPEWKQFEINKQAYNMGKRNDIWREHKLLH